MNSDTDESLHQKQSDGRSIEDQLVGIRKRLTWLTVAVFFVAAALLLFVAAVLGALIDFHYGESLLIAGTCTGGVAMGFLFGWLARRAGPG
jgi:hypothetical protein